MQLPKRTAVTVAGSTGFGSTGFQPVDNASRQDEESKQDACPTAGFGSTGFGSTGFQPVKSDKRKRPCLRGLGLQARGLAVLIQLQAGMMRKAGKMPALLVIWRKARPT
jgi:hypothetical protein